MSNSKNAIIIHGMNDENEFNSYKDSSSNAHFIPWLQRELCKNNILTQTPEMPKPYTPDYTAWKSVFLGNRIDAETDLIGHSCGGGFIIRFLSETDKRVNRVFLIAPWLDPGGELKNDFFKFKILENILDRANEVKVLYSSDDSSDILESIKILKDKFSDQVEFIEFKDKGHFCEGDIGREFPELLKLIINK